MTHQEKGTPGPKSSSGAAGCYHNDYSPRYKATYNIYEKAKEHARLMRRKHREDA